MFIRFVHAALGCVALTALALPDSIYGQIVLPSETSLEGIPGFTTSIPNATALTPRQQAESAYRTGDYEKVISLANTMIQSNASDATALYLRSVARSEIAKNERSANKMREAIEDARQALALAGARHPIFHVPYIYGLVNLSELEQRPDHVDLAIRVAGEALERGGMSAEDRSNVLLQRGLAYQSKKDGNNAIKDLQAAIEGNPKHLVAHLRLATLLSNHGQADAALAIFDKAVERFPTEPIVYNDRGSLRRLKGDRPGAIADFTKAISTNANFTMGYINRGFIQLEANNLAAAIDDLNNAVRLSPKHPVALRLRGNAQLANNQIAGALSDFTFAAAASPNDPVIRLELGFARYFTGDYANAATEFQKVLELSPTSIVAHPWQFLALTRSGQGEKAKTVLATFLDKTPDSPEGDNWVRNVCRFLIGRVTEADLTKLADASQEANPRKCEINFFAGTLDMIQGRNDAAKTRFRASLETKANFLSAFKASQQELTRLQ